MEMTESDVDRLPHLGGHDLAKTLTGGSISFGLLIKLGGKRR
jgi:hypothetical protein